MEKNLGHATAYGYAKSKGYSGTEEEFAQLMADYASVGQSAAQSAEQAAASATSASGSAATASQAAQTATNKASEAVTAADTATTKASEASTSADTASAAATSAGTSAQTATTASATATTKASEAAASEAAALSAKTDAESARDAAAQSASQAAESARTLTIDATLTQSGQAADAKAVGDKIGGVKSDLDEISSATKNLNTKGCGRYSANNSSGVISANTGENVVGMTDKILCKASTTYTVTYYDVTFTKAACYALYYDSNSNFLSTKFISNMNGLSGSFTTPDNAAYIYFYIYSGTGITISDSSKIQVEEGIVSSSYVQPITAYDLISREQLARIMNGLVSPISIDLYDGYYNANGVIVGSTAPNYEKSTQKIDATLYIGIEYQLNYLSSRSAWLACNVWKADGTFTRTVIVNETGSSFSGTVAISSDVVQIAFSFRSFGEENVLNLVGNANMQSFVKVASKSNAIDNNQTQSSIAINVNRFKPFYDHVFIDKINGNNVVIPSESLFNIQISRRLGFDMIEANVQATSDGKFIVMHGVSGKFGQQVEHIDGVTNIADTAINSVTLEWIKTNVRYKSLYAKYCVAPPSLEEFLYECRINCMIPLVTARDDGAVEIINNIMGKDNYVAYNGSRNKTAAPIMTFPSLTTKEDILALCDSYGKPYMYCMANPTAFTDAELVEIVDLLHTNGYLIGFAGCYQTEEESQRLLSLGFDFSASRYQINDIESGNICNLSADIDYSDFTTDGTVVNNLLTLAPGNTITPAETIPSVFLGGASMHIRFNGTLTIRMGSYINASFTSDGSKSMWFSTYYLNSAPTFTITATAQTQIINIDFKASKM